MAYQNIYATLSDNCSNRSAHTNRQRGKVNRINFNLNTIFGQGLSGRIDYRDANRYSEKPDLRKIPKAMRAQVLEQYEESLDANKKVHIALYMPEDKHFVYTINGIPITLEKLKFLNSERLEEFLVLDKM